MTFNPERWLAEVESDGSRFFVLLDQDPADPMDKTKWGFRLEHHFPYGTCLPIEDELRLWNEFRQGDNKRAVRDFVLQTRGYIGEAPGPTPQIAADAAA